MNLGCTQKKKMTFILFPVLYDHVESRDKVCVKRKQKRVLASANFV
jgi:hypothetical protein